MRPGNQVFGNIPIPGPTPPCASVTQRSLLAGLALLFSASVLAQEQGDWLLRLGVVNFDPSDSRGVLRAESGTNLGGAAISMDDNSQLGVTIGYMLTDSWAIEAETSASFKHEISIDGLQAQGLTTTSLGDTYLVTPTLSALYYFGTPRSNLRPYIGAGINYTRFFQASLTNQTQSELGARDLNLDDSVGLALRAGLDWKLRNGWFLNTSVSRIDMNTTVNFQTAADRFAGNKELNPWIYMFTLGHKF
jgi:outer membrane protein